MAGKINNYQLGQGGVNVTKDPLHLSDDELVQGQNVEIATDTNVGGVGALTKRGGLAPLSSALAGSVYGMIALPLQTTFTRTLYASLGTANANTWSTTTDGTTFTPIATPNRATITPSSDYNTIGTGPFAANRGMASYSTYLIYPGSNYTSSLASPSSNTSLDVDIWDGSVAAELFRLPIGPSSSDGNYAFTITDMLVANATIYFAVHDPVNTGANKKGRVLSLDVITGQVQQIAQTFGANANQMTGGVPVCLAYYQGKLWVGLDDGAGTANAGKVVSCYPGIDTIWTSDIATLPGYPKTLLGFGGNLYCGMRGNATNDAAIYVRTSSTGAWTSSDTTVTSGIDYYASLVSYNSELYSVVFSNGGADVELIRKFSAGSWSTDRDVAATDGAGIAFDVGNAVVYNSDLYISFLATSASNADGFILRKHSGTWSKVSTANYTGRLGVLLVKS